MHLAMFIDGDDLHDGVSRRVAGKQHCPPTGACRSTRIGEGGPAEAVSVLVVGPFRRPSQPRDRSVPPSLRVGVHAPMAGGWDASA